MQAFLLLCLSAFKIDKQLTYALNVHALKLRVSCTCCGCSHSPHCDLRHFSQNLPAQVFRVAAQASRGLSSIRRCCNANTCNILCSSQLLSGTFLPLLVAALASCTDRPQTVE